MTHSSTTATAKAPDERRVLGFWAAVSIVMGSMIGSGVFLLPASLAAYQGLSLIGWIVSAAGSVMLALVFARLARQLPAAGGQVAAIVEELEPLAEQAEAAHVAARPVSFLTENVGIDLARIATDQKCDAILLGWHHALLQRQIVRALVFRTFLSAQCDVVVFVDRKARKLPPSDPRPVLAMLSGGEHDEAACETAVHLAKALNSSVRLAGLPRQGTLPETLDRHLAHSAAARDGRDGVRIEALSFAGPVRKAFTEESNGAVVCVMVVGDDWRTMRSFGHPTADLVETAGCPVLVLRAGPRVATSVRREQPMKSE